MEVKVTSVRFAYHAHVQAPIFSDEGHAPHSDTGEEGIYGCF